MDLTSIVTLIRGAVGQIFIIAAPPLLSALIVGLVVAIFQATTSIQEQSLSFLTKLIVILVVVALLGGWMFTTLRGYTLNLFNLIPRMARS